jgi:hypothetical protein
MLSYTVSNVFLPNVRFGKPMETDPNHRICREPGSNRRGKMTSRPIEPADAGAENDLLLLPEAAIEHKNFKYGKPRLREK